MTSRIPSSWRPTRAALGMRWLILAVILFGTNISSIGGTNSHGLAAISAALHVAPSSSDELHGHVHEDHGNELAEFDQNVGTHLLHHEPDHSHDNAHALPAAWSSAPPQLPECFGLVRPWIEMVQPSRLDRPPIG